MAHSPSLHERGCFKEGPHRLFISPFEFYYLVPSSRSPGVPRFLPSYAPDTGRAIKKSHHAPSPPERIPRVIIYGISGALIRTIMDNRVFAAHNKTALYCASYRYFFPPLCFHHQLPPLLRNHRVLFFYISSTSLPSVSSSSSWGYQVS